jgi:AcrR family transcriptional regulator
LSFDKSFDHQQELFDAAVAEFITAGYEQASINTILQNAGMSKGQFYYHFKNKEGLYLALIDIVIARKKAFMTELVKPADFAQDIFSILKTQVQYGLAFTQAHPVISRFAESFAREKGNAIYEKALAVYNFDDDGFLNQLIDQAVQRGEIRDDLPLPLIRRLMGYLFTHAVDLVDLSQASDFERNLTYLIEFIKNGLIKK